MHNLRSVQSYKLPIICKSENICVNTRAVSFNLAPRATADIGQTRLEKIYNVKDRVAKIDLVTIFDCDF